MEEGSWVGLGSKEGWGRVAGGVVVVVEEEEGR